MERCRIRARVSVCRKHAGIRDAVTRLSKEKHPQQAADLIQVIWLQLHHILGQRTENGGTHYCSLSSFFTCRF
jgi:hypothetical protein